MSPEINILPSKTHSVSFTCFRSPRVSIRNVMRYIGGNRGRQEIDLFHVYTKEFHHYIGGQRTTACNVRAVAE